MRFLIRNIYLDFMGKLKIPKPGIHIINSHFVTANEVIQIRDTQIFENYLHFLNQFSKFITLEEATRRILMNKIPKDEVLIAFTFDDGFEECSTIIAPLLERYNCRGAFFINANYIGSNKEYQEGFNQRISNKNKRPMNWNQVIDLHKRGHLIGSHNLDHTNFADLEIDEIELQLSKNKKILEKKLNYKCEYFAWTYGQLQHFPIKTLELTEKHHKYIFSGTNYKDYFSYNGRVLNRRHQEANWPNSHIKYFLSFRKKYNR